MCGWEEVRAACASGYIDRQWKGIVAKLINLAQVTKSMSNQQ